ncbi:DUF2812 domain-containing protein [Enterococcus sp. BWM-S5]|uniref:DUF2812 domain-containing protein n=1 Tax=Enterococcus larvae TaxID=2794352 RepID=A0ABS4CMR3_9ENTE|nr:DUF2812 domain-containing protein [Enterococcus larvae]MBP1047864.1 DUF2812 domain-containing protein [Enterococcus larvae]
MKRIRFWFPVNSEEKWLNKQAKNGYELDTIVPFRLFVPLEMRVYEFKKTKNKNLHYRIDYRSFPSKEALNDYLDLLKEDGWQHFKKDFSYDNTTNALYFYNVTDSHKELFSDKQSEKERNHRASFTLVKMSLLPFLAAVLLPYYRNLPPADSFLSFIGKYFFPLATAGMLIAAGLLKITEDKKTQLHQ